MTLEDFLKVLKASRERVKWVERATGEIRCDIEGQRCCPITAVSTLYGGPTLRIPQYAVAGKAIGLADDIAYRIAYAADTRKPAFDAALRADLLEATAAKLVEVYV